MKTEKLEGAQYYDADTGFLLGYSEQPEIEHQLPKFKSLRREVGAFRSSVSKEKELNVHDVSSHF